MKVLLINVSLRPESVVKFFPTGLSYVASAVKRSRHELEIIDIDASRMSPGEVERRIASADFDVVGIGCIVTGYRIVKELASVLRRANPNCLIVLGNTVGSSIPQIALSKTEADVVVMGEGEVTFVEILDALEDGSKWTEVPGIAYLDDDSLVLSPERPVIEDISEIPHPIWELFDMEEYIKGGATLISEPLPMPREQIRPFQVNTARGCLFNCTFCYHAFKNRRYRTRSPESIVSEMRTLKDRYGINYIRFWDELTFYSVKQANQIVDAILEADLQVYWTADSRGNMFKDDEDLALAHKMKAAGCIGLGYSLESADSAILQAMEKKITPEDFLTQKAILDKADIATWTSLVFGYPQETPETIKATMSCCLEAGLYPSAGYLLPQPGTKMYQYAIDNGFIDDEESYLMRIGDRQDLHVNLTTMSDSEFTENVESGLSMLNEYLEIGLTDEKLIKMGHWRQRADSEAGHEH